MVAMELGLGATSLLSNYFQRGKFRGELFNPAPFLSYEAALASENARTDLDETVKSQSHLSN